VRVFSGVDFDDEELPYVEEDKSDVKVGHSFRLVTFFIQIYLIHQSPFSFSQRANETFYATLTSTLTSGVLGSCALALRETSRPDIKQTKSTLTGTVLRLGDTETREAEALEVLVKSSKCTALSRPKSWKKFAVRTDDPVEEDMGDEEVDGEGGKKVAYAQLKMRTEYYVDRSEDNGDDEDEDVKMEVDEDEDEEKKRKDENLEKVEKEQLVRGFKYGTTYAPCPDGQFPRLNTKKGIDICGFFQAKNVCRFSLTYPILFFPHII
jgi:ATP-dependent DNA helicase 2 subunit 2